jgi:hypothetical protein
MKRLQVGNDFYTVRKGHEKLREKAYIRYRRRKVLDFCLSAEIQRDYYRTTARAADLTIIVAVDYGTINSHFVQLNIQIYISEAWVTSFIRIFIFRLKLMRKAFFFQ